MLQATLLTAALFCFLTLVVGHIASAVDGAKTGKEWLEQILVATGTTGVVALLLGGGTFALVVKATRTPADPSEGRGTGTA